MVTAQNLMKFGFFPKEIPPAFSSESFGSLQADPSFISSGALVAPNNQGRLSQVREGYSNLCRHNLARLDGSNRRLQIPHPVHYFELSQIIETNWAFIDQHLSDDRISLSIPKIDTNNSRAIISNKSGTYRPEKRLQDRAQGNVLLVVDVANFYGTIYTHSIPWALHTKRVAKNDRTDRLFGNYIDKIIRNSQDGQTIGIPIGTDISFLVAEIILAYIDKEIQNKFPDLVGFRFFDDYEFVVSKEEDARQLLASIEDLLEEYELSINQRKSKIIALPDSVEQIWFSELRNNSRLLNGIRPMQLRDQFIDYVNLSFELASRYPNDPVLRYSLALLTKINLRNIWTLYQNFLIQVFREEPQVASYVSSELLSYESKGCTIDIELIKKSIYDQVVYYSSRKSSNEISWCIWLAILFSINIDDKVAANLTSSQDNFVALLTLHARSKGLITNLDTSEWGLKIAQNSIYSCDWLLAYEAATKGWLPIIDGSDYINAHPCFGQFHIRSISFYDENSYENHASVLTKLKNKPDIYST